MRASVAARSSLWPGMTWMAEAPSQFSISVQALDSLAPERLFDLRWAATVVEQALRRLREECESKGRLRVFETLSLHLTAERSDVSYAQLAAMSRRDRDGGEKANAQSARALPLAPAR